MPMGGGLFGPYDSIPNVVNATLKGKTPVITEEYSDNVDGVASKYLPSLITLL